MADWLCQDCKSVNSSGAQNCYRCWTPRRFAEAPDAATLPPGVTVEQAHEERKQRLRPSIADARSSRRRSWIVLGCITATVAVSALSLTFVGAKGGSIGVALSFLSGDSTVLGSLVAISLVGGLLALAAMIAWFVWFDRVLANVPRLTGTWPEVSRVMAVVWWLVPIIGQLRGTFVVGHVYALTAVAGSPGTWLLGLWGITWIGGTLAPGVAGFIVGWLPLPLEESVHLQDLISNVGQISYIAAGFFAAALILALEHARDVRMSGHPEEAVADAEVSLEDRLAGGSLPRPTSAPTMWSGAPPSWPTGPGLGQDEPPVWPSGSDPWPGGTEPGWPTVRPTSRPEGPAPDPAPRPSAGRKRSARDRGPVPFEPILLMGVLVLVGVVAGITMAGMADPLGTLGRRPTAAASNDQASARPRATMGPDATMAPTSTRPPMGPTSAPTGAPMASPTLGATPPATPAPASLVARRILRVMSPGSYHGLMEIQAALTEAEAAGSTTWDILVGRAGEREYRRQTVQRPGTDAEVFERAAIVSITWERAGRDDWTRRRREDRDQAAAPLFDVTDAGQLSFRDLVDEDGERLYRFAWEAGDDRLGRFLASVGVEQDLVLRSGELLATAQGVPVRLQLRFDERGSGAATLDMTVRYSEIGSDIEVRSPRVGPPLVVHR